MTIVHLAHAVAAHPFIWCLGLESLIQIRLFVVSGVRLVREGLARSVGRIGELIWPSLAVPVLPKPRRRTLPA